MVQVEISTVALQPTISNALTVHKFQSPLCSAGVFPWTSGGIEVDYMSLVKTNFVKSQEVMHFFLECFCVSLYLLISQFFLCRVHTLIASGLQITSEAAVSPLLWIIPYLDIRISICPTVATLEELGLSPHLWRRKSKGLPERTPSPPPWHPSAASRCWLSTLPPGLPYLPSCPSICPSLVKRLQVGFPALSNGTSLPSQTEVVY